VSKLVSSLGDASLLQVSDPIFKLPFRYVLIGAAVAELIVAIICFFSDRIVLKAGLIAFLATNFSVYRLGLWLIGYHGHCLCLGNLTDAIHLSPHAADIIMKVILAYLLIGSYITLFRLKWHRNYFKYVNQNGA
jgi:hypothetical protein